jgi:hypothetical protein
MRSLLRHAACAALLGPAFALAQTPAAAPASAAAATAAERGAEPNVRRSVIEDDANRIEELQVRGQARSIVVTTKGALAGSYEIHVGDPSREMSADADARRGTAGQRMWRVFEF